MKWQVFRSAVRSVWLSLPSQNMLGRPATHREYTAAVLLVAWFIFLGLAFAARLGGGAIIPGVIVESFDLRGTLIGLGILFVLYLFSRALDRYDDWIDGRRAPAPQPSAQPEARPLAWCDETCVAYVVDEHGRLWQHTAATGQTVRLEDRWWQA